MGKAFKILDLSIWLVAILFFIWSLGAVYYLPWLPNQLNLLLVLAYLVIAILAAIRSAHQWSGRAIFLACSTIVFLSTLLIRPSNDRIWADDHSKIAEVQIVDGRVTINNFRNSTYRSELDYDAKFETRKFPLDAIDSVWLIVQKFTPSEGMAHVFLSFGLKTESKRDYFSVSVEVRREQGEFYHPIRGLYRTYELTHVIGDERDLIGVRTVHRPDDRVFMYRVNATDEQAQKLFKQFANRIAGLKERPEFYNTLLNNCANGVTGLTYELTPQPINWLDPLIVLPGYSAQFALEKGLVGDKSMGYDELEPRSRIDRLAKKHGIEEGFSNAIRAGIVN